MSANTIADISSEEQEQILQTIEMFEVITQANQNDCQSLEVLKEAYWKIGRHPDALKISRRLADAYIGVGQYASAMLELEGIIQKDPDNKEVAELIAEVETKLNDTNYVEANHRMDGAPLDLNGEAPHLMRTNSTLRPEGEAMVAAELDLGNDGNDPLCKFLIQHKLVDPNSVNACIDRVRARNQAPVPDGGPRLAMSLIEELCESNAADLEALLCGILDRTKLAYAPLEYYDVDRQIVRMLPESLTLGRLIVPFDLISRTVMIAMANPFDALGKQAVQQLFDYNIQWHVASPEAISKTLASVYRIDLPGKK